MPLASYDAPLEDFHRSQLLVLCSSRGLNPHDVVEVFSSARRTLVFQLDQDQSKGPRSIAHLFLLFSNMVEAERPDALMNLNWEKALMRRGFGERLAAAAAFTELLLDRRMSVHERGLREESVVSTVRDLLDRAIEPTPESQYQVDLFAKNASAFFQRLVAFEQAQLFEDRQPRLSDVEVRYTHRIPEVVAAGLLLLLKSNMPASVVMKVADVLPRISDVDKREAAINYYRSLARDGEAIIGVGEPRLPDPLGRPSLVGAMKSHSADLRHYMMGSPTSWHEFPVEIPTSAHIWEYFGQRITALGAIKSPEVRDDRLLRYMASFVDFLASHPFFEKEEIHFRGVNLEGSPSAEYRIFYRDEYGVDSTPGAEGSNSSEVVSKETARAFRQLAATRYGINVRKGYARPLESGQWLLEQMVEDLGGEAQRFRVSNINLYPGPGVRISGLKAQNALDFSTESARRLQLKNAPWLGASIRCGHEVEYLMMRGFVAITRSLDATMRRVSPEWSERASVEVYKTETLFKHFTRIHKVLEKEPTPRRVRKIFDESLRVDRKQFWREPYSAIWFNDHFHNDRLPETRMWLVPERVLHRKMMFAIENKVDPNTLDITPEGMAEEAEALGLPIFNIGTSSVRWGGFSNAWPHGVGLSREWERDCEWSYTRWQDPHHVHRALVGEQYYEYLTKPVGQVMARARVEHDELLKVYTFFQDLHSSFLTMEEAWAKGYVSAGEAPARLEGPPLAREQRSDLARGDAEGSADEAPEESFEFPAPTRPRTKMLLNFLELRNMMAKGNTPLQPNEFPTLELQYTRMFSRQAGTPYISGADMQMYFPDGTRISLLGKAAKPGVIHKGDVELNERIEALWDAHFVSRFAPNNCPRIFLP